MHLEINKYSHVLSLVIGGGFRGALARHPDAMTVSPTHTLRLTNRLVEYLNHWHSKCKPHQNLHGGGISTPCSAFCLICNISSESELNGQMDLYQNTPQVLAARPLLASRVRHPLNSKKVCVRPTILRKTRVPWLHSLAASGTWTMRPRTLYLPIICHVAMSVMVFVIVCLRSLVNTRASEVGLVQHQGWGGGRIPPPSSLMLSHKRRAQT